MFLGEVFTWKLFCGTRSWRGAEVRREGSSCRFSVWLSWKGRLSSMKSFRWEETRRSRLSTEDVFVLCVRPLCFAVSGLTSATSIARLLSTLVLLCCLKTTSTRYAPRNTRDGCILKTACQKLYLVVVSINSSTSQLKFFFKETITTLGVLCLPSPLLDAQVNVWVLINWDYRGVLNALLQSRPCWAVMIWCLAVVSGRCATVPVD